VTIDALETPVATFYHAPETTKSHARLLMSVKSGGSTQGLHVQSLTPSRRLYSTMRMSDVGLPMSDLTPQNWLLVGKS